MNRSDFIEKVGTLARKSMEKSGILASLTTAQAILESGWGASGLTVKGNALFGIKAGANWKGKIYSAKTKECYDGKNFVDITAAFRAYNSWEESIEDHAKLLTSLPRYKALVGEKDYKKACIEIKKAGYATDPGYPQKLISIIEDNNLTRFDNKNKAIDNKKQENNKNTQIGGGKMKASIFIEKLNSIVKNYKTRYAWGCFGCPLKPGIIESKAKQYPGHYSAAVKNELLRAGNQGAYGFDCVNLIKGLAWGWRGDWNKSWGGAEYASNGVPDINADQMITRCAGVSTDFSKIVPGEAVWLPGHIGVYVGGGVVIEATPIWKNGVQKSALENKGKIAGLPSRRWQKHGKLPFIVYDVEQTKPKQDKPTPKTTKSIEEVAKEVLDGKWGNGNERKERLEAAGYTYMEVQNKVNELLKKPAGSGAIKTGDKVKITGTNYATGQAIPQWVKAKTHTVAAVNNEKALLKEINSYVYLKDLTK